MPRIDSALLSHTPNTLCEYALFHTVSGTEAFLLPALECGTPCHHICGEHELRTFQAFTERIYVNSRPWCIVTNLLSCALEAYLHTYLLTYLLTYHLHNNHIELW